MKYNYIFSLAVFYLLISCAGGSKASENADAIAYEDDQSPIYIFLEDILQKEGAEPLSSAVSEIVYIPLETKNYSLLRSINRIEYLNGKYIVSDGNNIYLFNQEGKYIKRVAQQGGGPSDYPTPNIHNIIVDPVTNHFYLFAYYKVIKFDENVIFLNNFQIEDIGIEQTFPTGIFTPHNTIMLGLPNHVRQYDDTTEIYNALEVDTLGYIINKYINLSPRYAQMRGGHISSDVTSLYVFNNDIRFIDFGNDSIFSIEDDSMIPYAVLDLGKKKTNLIIDVPLDNPQKGIEFIKNMKGHTIRNIVENDIFLFICLTKNGPDGELINCLYNKSTKELKLLKNNSMLNDLDGGSSFFPKKTFEDNVLIDWKSAEEFKEEILSKDYNSQKAKYGERFEKVYQLAKSLLEDDNPVLIIAKK